MNPRGPKQQPSDDAPKAILQIWEFANAPADLRKLVPADYKTGWLALICAGQVPEFINSLVGHWTATMKVVWRHDVDDGGVILAGDHPHRRPED